MGNYPEEGYVKMAKKICVITGKEYESGELLISKTLTTIPDEQTIVDYGISPEYQKQIDDGYVILIGAADHGALKTASLVGENSPIRTGQIISIKKDKFEGIMGVVPPEKSIAFVTKDIIESIQKLYDRIEKED